MSQFGNLVQICSQNRKGLLYAAGVGLGIIGVGILMKSLLKRRQRKLIQVGIVSQMCIYPIKSCKGVSVNTAECLEMGLKHGELRDRHWLVIQEDGHKVTGRQEPRLVLITASSDDVYLYLNAAEMEELRVPLKLSRSNSLKDCRVWGSDIQGRDCGDEASRWITRYLNNEKTFRLVQYELDMQPRRPHDTEKRFKPKDKIAYPDNSPIMLLSEASLEDLNTRVEKKVEMRNFRPSIVVTGCDAYAEDSWDEIQIGSTCLRRVMACGRCIFTTVDPETGVIDRKQPLETLKRHWLVIQENGYKVNGSHQPRLVLIAVSIVDGYLCLNAPQMQELEIPLQLPRSNAVKDCRVWGTDIQSRDCGNVAFHWITHHLNNKHTFRLVQFEYGRRPQETEKNFRKKI